MIQPTGIGPAGNLIVLRTSGDRSIHLRVGSIVRASVSDVRKDGSLMLKITDPEGGKPLTLKAISEIPIEKGQAILLQVNSASDVLSLRLLSGVRERPPLQIPQQLSALLNSARLDSEEVRQLALMLDSLPESIKNDIPGFGRLLKLLNMDIQDMRLLRAFVESSGVGLETRLRIAALGHSQGMQGILSLQENGDLKAVLLNLQKLLEKKDTAAELKRAGLSLQDVTALTGRFLRNIEFLQLTSRLNHIYFTFLPPNWKEMNDGEIIFRKDRGGRRGSWTCDINLDLKDSGRLRASITMSGMRFLVTFHVESDITASSIEKKRDFLLRRFSAAGFELAAVNIIRTKRVEFGKPGSGGISLKI
jgi:hypothetical protein